MNNGKLQNLLGRWLLVLVLSYVVGVVWLEPDIAAGRGLSSALKFAVVLGAVVSAALLMAHSQAVRWRSRIQSFENFVSALPATESNLPEGGPEEMQRLSRALAAMARRLRNVVERENLESSRRETILACMAEGVLAVDPDLRVVFCNEAFAQAFNARRSMAQGRTLFEVVREPVLRDILEQVVTTGAPQTDRFQLPTAGSRWFEARALPLGSAPGRGAVIVLHDVTGIEIQERMRKDFVADVSHELRTPLAAIRGYAETLLDGALDEPENSRRFVEIILSHTIRLSNIASDLLVLSELDSNTKPPGPPERVPVLEVIDSAIHTIEKAAAARAIRIDTDRCAECFVSGFRFRLEQAVVNLLDNAVKFNRNEGEITIECGPAPDGLVRISVGDTGTGIPSGDIKRIFERFYRVDKARSRPSGGTGLGLPIVREVLERMGGSVAVESQLGRGSRFTILLPSA